MFEISKNDKLLNIVAYNKSGINISNDCYRLIYKLLLVGFVYHDLYNMPDDAIKLYEEILKQRHEMPEVMNYEDLKRDDLTDEQIKSLENEVSQYYLNSLDLCVRTTELIDLIHNFEDTNKMTRFEENNEFIWKHIDNLKDQRFNAFINDNDDVLNPIHQ